MFERRDNPLDFNRSERMVIIGILFGWLVLATSPYWLGALLGDGDLPTAATEAELAEFGDEVALWVAKSERLQDSIEAGRANRDSLYADRKATSAQRKIEWEARRAGWAAEKLERTRKRSANQRKRYSTPLPPVASLDPNTVSVAQLERLGLPSYIAERWTKYRDKAGGFNRETQIAKLYGLEDSTWTRVRSYFNLTQLSSSAFAQNTSPSNSRQGAGTPAATFTSDRVSSPAAPTAPVNVNDASEEDLTAIRGIGSFYAKQILDYRDRLGGFTSVDQLAEVPKLREGAYEAWVDMILVDASEITKLHINSADARTLARHPYLPFRKAQTIVAYREHHGPYTAIDDLYEVGALDATLIEQMRTYMTVD